MYELENALKRTNQILTEIMKMKIKKIITIGVVR